MASKSTKDKTTKDKPASLALRKLYTPPPVQYRIMARHANGESNREIARQEGMDRATVNRILGQDEYVAMLAEQQSLLMKMGYKALAVFGKALDCDDLPTAVGVASKVLQGSGVFSKRGLQSTIDEAQRIQAISVLQVGPPSWPPEGELPTLEVQPVRESPSEPKLLEGLVIDYSFGSEEVSSEAETTPTAPPRKRLPAAKKAKRS